MSTAIPNSQALWLAFLYLALIPLFAAIYSAIPEHFHHSNLEKEAEYQRLSKDVEKQIVESFLSSLDLFIAERKELDPSWDGRFYEPTEGAYSSFDFTKFENVHAEIVGFDRNQILLNLSYTMRSSVDVLQFGEEDEPRWIKDYQKEHSDRVSIKGAQLLDRYVAPTREVFWVEELDVQALDLDADRSEQLKNDFEFDEEDIRYINRGFHSHLDISTAPIIRMLEMDDGYSRPSFDNFVRMLYFSAVTISTLGYGDIAPTSALARILITLEVVIGLVVIGLFLNAVASKRTNGV